MEALDLGDPDLDLRDPGDPLRLRGGADPSLAGLPERDLEPDLERGLPDLRDPLDPERDLGEPDPDLAGDPEAEDRCGDPEPERGEGGSEPASFSPPV